MASHPVAQTDVVVIGGGPVGVALAIDLTQRGIRCQLIERRTRLQPIPKGQNLTQRTMEYMALLGAEDAIRARRTIADTRVGGMMVYGRLTSGIAYDWLVRSAVSGFYHRRPERLPQPETERALRGRLTDLGTHASFGWTAEVTGVDPDGVTVVSRDAHGRIATTRARFVVACDGSGSRTRTAAGITQTRVDHDRTMALVVFRSRDLDRIVARYPQRQFFSVLHPRHDGYWQFLGRVDSEAGWFFHAPVAAHSQAELDIPQLVAEAVGEPVPLDVQHVGFWDLRFALADSYRAGRIFLAGDAAHSHPPYGGYGVNSGFEDAANLAWKLQIAITTGDESILDSYDEERRPVFASTAEDFIDSAIRSDRDFLRTFEPETPGFTAEWERRAERAATEVAAYAPHYGSSSRIVGGDGVTSAWGDHRVRARPGYRLSPWEPSAAEVLERLGGGFALLSAAPEQTGPLERAAREMGVRLTVVPLQADAVTAYQAQEILVRPDLYVAAVARNGGLTPGELAIASGREAALDRDAGEMSVPV